MIISLFRIENCFTLHHSRSYGKREDPTSEGIQADLAASYQEAICETLAKKAFDAFDRYEDVEEVYVTGGVSANRRLREVLFLGSNKRKIGFHFPKK